MSCDSVAVYRYFEIGTAKPSWEERALVPHHLLDVTLATEPFTAGEYARQARVAIADITRREKLPIVVGGTGLYLRALLEGLFPGPQRSAELRERLQARATERGSMYLHRILTRLDSVAATRIHANDTPKLIRAIEVCVTTRGPMSELWQERDPLVGYRIFRIGLDPPREMLYTRINERACAMFDQGLIEETQSLLGRYGTQSTVAPLSSLGYKQSVQFLRRELTLQEAVAAAQQGHRNYAKRQMTWFRREPNVTWLRGFGDDQTLARSAEETILAETQRK